MTATVDHGILRRQPHIQTKGRRTGFRCLAHEMAAPGVIVGFRRVVAHQRAVDIRGLSRALAVCCIFDRRVKTFSSSEYRTLLTAKMLRGSEPFSGAK
jgi:hypothetical protein